MKNQTTHLFFSIVLIFAIASCGGGQKRASTADLRTAYAAAVADAKVAEESEISDRLTPVVPGKGGTIWKEFDGERHVLTSTWTSWDGYDDKVGTSTQLGREIWITLAPQVAEFCSDSRIPAGTLDLRLKQLIGLPPGNKNTRFVEIWARPADMFRPCPDAEIDDNVCSLDFPPGTSDEHKKWINDLEAASYGEDGYPWTRLGYTYDWGSESGEFGLSEYLVRKGASVRVHSVSPTKAYCGR